MEPFLGDGVSDAEFIGVKHEPSWVALLFVGIGVDGVC